MLVFVDKQSFYLSKHSSNETVFTENGEHKTINGLLSCSCSKGSENQFIDSGRLLLRLRWAGGGAAAVFAQTELNPCFMKATNDGFTF